MEAIRRGNGDWIGRADLAPADPVVAGSVGTWAIRYTAGRYGVDDGGSLKLSWRTISDWARPQSSDPAAADFLAVETSAQAVLATRFEPRGNVRPWGNTVHVRVLDGFLRPGEALTITVGDRRQGSPGTRAQTFCENRFRFRLFVDCFGAEVYEEVEEDLGFPIVSGEAARLVAILPAHAVAGQPTWAFVRAEDRWGNPAAGYRGTVAIAPAAGIEGLPPTYAFTGADGGARRFEGVRFAKARLYTVTARDEAAGLVAESNPLLCEATAPALRPFWGDLHGQSGETIGTNTVADYFRFARDKAAIDFCCHQGNDFQVTPAVWAEIKRQTRAFHAPGRFVTFLGVEWSAITGAGGDHNVIYPGDDGPIHRSSHWQVADRADAHTDAYPVAELYRAFGGQDVILLPHIGGRRADLRWHDPALEPVIEVHSCWGTFEWFLDEALERGYRVGFVAGSDDHKCRPGAAAPGAGAFGVLGGLTCLYARDLTREALWEALRARRASCSTGERVLAQLRGDGHWMGEEYEAAGAPRFEVFVAGTDALEEVLIRRGTETAYAHPLAPPTLGNRIRVAWTGARILDRNRQQAWDGGLRIEGARIRHAETYFFDTPAEGITRWDAGEVRWRSRTAGDEDGVILTLDDPTRGTLHFESEPIRFSVPLAEVGGQGRVFPAGGIRRQVVVKRLPAAPGPRAVRFTWSDPGIRPGWNAYYVRVKQANGSLAWTSPVYVRRT
jgi:hypothetical protein